jgi:hypothetical protein
LSDVLSLLVACGTAADEAVDLGVMTPEGALRDVLHDP